MYEHTVMGQFVDHQYILEPVSAHAKMKRNTSALPLRGQNSSRCVAHSYLLVSNTYFRILCICSLV